MNFYWRFKNIPELAELPAHKRTIVWHACKRLAWRHWQMWLGALVAALLGVSVCAGLLFALLPWAKYRLWAFFLMGFLSGALGMGIGWWLTELVRTNLIRPHLRRIRAELLSDVESEPEEVQPDRRIYIEAPPE